MTHIILLLSLLTTNAYANEKRMYVLGGGGDPEGASTIFDADLKNVSKFVKKSQWKTNISFNGGHTQTEEIISEKFPPGSSKGHFVKKNYDSILSEIKLKLESGELKTGDQLLIMLDTHGAQNRGEQSHSVAFANGTTSDFNNLTGAMTVSLDTLKPIIELAKKKGVKFAFIDQSCHSGNSLNLPSDNVCIISASGPKHYGYGGSFEIFGHTFPSAFVGHFVKNMAPGKNLEEIFQKARIESDAPDFPMISTPEGKEIQNLLYDLITPYLYYNDSITKKFDSLYDVKNIDESICQMKNRFNDLSKIINDLEKIKNISYSASDFAFLKTTLNTYRNYQVKYENAYKDLRGVSVEIIATLHKDYPKESSMFDGSDGVSIINTNYKLSIETYQKLYAETKAGPTKDFWKKSLDNLKTQMRISQELKNKLSKASLNKINIQKKIFEESDITHRYASEISPHLKKLYQALYKKNKRTESNPCRDFVL